MRQTKRAWSRDEDDGGGDNECGGGGGDGCDCGDGDEDQLRQITLHAPIQYTVQYASQVVL